MHWSPQTVSFLQETYMLHYQAKRDNVDKTKACSSSPKPVLRTGVKQGKKLNNGKNCVRCFPNHMNGKHVTNGKACASFLVLHVNMEQMDATSVMFKGRFEQEAQ